ncbi:KAP family P-loop NTPase fold protein [Cetobacterium sp.]|uniref:KAP family P-loop NTPase fold protein n=1 Tax=Cetobacterium sp. TaxID=2071632 RepID=UPI003EE7F20E
MEDKLNRKPIIQNLTEVIEQLELERGIVVGIDAGWGKGKTTFINLWEEYLNENKNDNYSIIKFNTWDRDDSGNPLLSLIIELEELLSGETKEEIYSFTKELLKGIIPNLIERATCGGIKADDLNILLNAHDTLKCDLIEREKSRIELKKKLKDSISKLGKGKKIIFFIDELDRCRPLYAIELLETIKHLFNVKNCIFILAWDKVQLSESIKTVYGMGMDSSGYLRRFIDLDYQLPEPSKKDYINYLIEKEELKESYYPTFYEILPNFCDVYDLSLRDIDKLVFYLSIHLKRVEKIDRIKTTYEYVYSLLKALLIIIKIKQVDIYLKIREKNYLEEDISKIVIEMQIEKLEKTISTKRIGLDKSLRKIIITFLECNINVNKKNHLKYELFKGEGWNYEDQLDMKYFCENSLILNEIEFLESLNISN